MLQVVRRILPILAGIAACACNQVDFRGLFMPTGDNVQSRFEESMEILSDLKAAEIDAHERYVFYVAADPHVITTHKNLDRFDDIFRNDAEASFGIILGDCINLRDNFPEYLEALACYPERHAFDHPVFHLLGNHDTFFNGWDEFKELIGPSVYWFEVVFPEGKDLYIALDSASGTLGRKQTQWLRAFLEDNRSIYRHCVILTHTNLFYTDNSQTGSGNMPIEESFSLIDFLGRHNVSLVLQGHDHYREDLTFDNVRYTVLGTIRDESDAPEYLKVHMNDEEIFLDWQLII